MTDTATIYRIEHHKTGQGPFTAGHVRTSRHYGNWIYHPCPYEDRMACGRTLRDGMAALARNRGEACYFGFASLQQMRDWVTPGALKEALDSGFVVRAYTVPAQYAATARRQAVFVRWRALARQTLPKEALGLS